MSRPISGMMDDSGKWHGVEIVAMKNKHIEEHCPSQHDPCIPGRRLCWVGSKLRGVLMVVSTMAITLVILMPAVSAFASDGAGEKEVSVWREIKIPRAKEGKRIYPVRMSTVSPDADWAALTYGVKKADGQHVQEIVILDLETGSSKSIIVPYWRYVKSVQQGKRLAIYSTSIKGYFVEIDTLRRVGPEIPAGFFRVFERGDIVCVKDEEGSVWIYDAVADRQVRLMHGTHKLRNIRIVAAKNRLVISGWPPSQSGKALDLFREGRDAEAGKLMDPMKRTLRTQLWTLPDLKLISEHSAVEPVPSSNWSPTFAPRRIGAGRYAYQAGFGLWHICSLDTGKFLYSIGKPLGVPKKGHEDQSGFLQRVLGRHRGIVFFDGRGHDVEANRIVWVRDEPGSKVLELKSCNARTGTETKSATVPKIDGEDMQWLSISGGGESRTAVICQGTGGLLGESKLDFYRIRDFNHLYSIRLKGISDANIHVTGGKLVCVRKGKVLLRSLTQHR